jgi:UV DNA damage endonuclease
VRQLPGWERGFALENDDRTYDPDDVLDAAERLGLPVVLDFLHARVLPGRTPLDDAVAAAARTWRRAGLSLRPKYHLSSALSPRRPRDHAPYIAPEDALAALASLSHVGEDVDVVLEAKEKDAALFRLMADLAGLPGIVPASPASLDVGPAPPGAGARELLE